MGLKGLGDTSVHKQAREGVVEEKIKDRFLAALRVVLLEVVKPGNIRSSKGWLGNRLTQRVSNRVWGSTLDLLNQNVPRWSAGMKEVFLELSCFLSW